MSAGQVLRQVRLPHAAPVVLAGVRTVAVISVGTATLAAFVGAGGLGAPIVEGLQLNDTAIILGGALPAVLRPDGDALVSPAQAGVFRVPDCPSCGGVLKPAVVFFGENVPRPRVEHALGRLRASAAVLAVGTSLTVYSGFRFCREAAGRGIPIALVNRGKTRADDLTAIRLDGDVGAVLPALAARLGTDGIQAADCHHH